MANRGGERGFSCIRSRCVSSLHIVDLVTHQILPGGTNLRVCLVTIQGEGKFEITQSKYRLTEEQKQDDGQKLFDFCAESLKTFIDTTMAENTGIHLEKGQKLPLGFTVSIF